MKNKQLFTAILLFITSIAIAQTEEGSRVILENNGLSNTAFYVYAPVFQAKGIYKDLSEVKNNYPEQVMSSLMSVTSQAWEDFNTLGGTKEAEQKEATFFEAIKNMDKDKNYFDLRCKLEYEANGEKFAVIKFYLTRQGAEPICGAYAFQEVDNRWYKTATPLSTSIAFMLMTFDETKLDLLFQKKQNVSPFISELLDKSLENDKISLVKLISISDKWIENKQQNLVDYFFDKNSWINKKL